MDARIAVARTPVSRERAVGTRIEMINRNYRLVPDHPPAHPTEHLQP